MDILSLTKVTSLFILTLIERDDGQKKLLLYLDRCKYLQITSIVCI